ncbi:MAG: hypothetical protein FJX77_03190, partial [Armatimonadetes bacterium]|nr:hypothetical protein [Armatimonadota bacterium]
MYNRIQLGRNGLLLVVSSLALGLVPLGRLQSHEAAPSREQIVHYHLARNAWASAARAGSPAARQALASCAESHLTHSLEGADFPEAHLALGLLYFNRSGNGERFDPDAYRAERHLRHAADQGAGAIRAEAQTYLGVLALHCKHWGMARQMFDSAAGADLRATHISVHSARLSEEYQTRAQRLAAVQKVGSALATYWMAVDPASPAPSPAAYQGALRALDSMGAPELNGTGAALWRFPEQEHARPRNLPVPVFPAARANWTLGAAATPPTGVEAVAADRFAAAGRIWAAGRLGMEPPRTAVAGLGTQDRRNLMMGLVRTLYTLESQRNYAGANAILTRLAEISEANTLVRQHRIWIALEGAPNLAQAAQLINGPGAQEDPLYAQQLVTLANKQAAAGQTDAARAAWGRVAAMTGQGPAAARNVARWNLAALALNQRTNDDDPEKWQRALQLSGPAPQGNTAPARARRYLQLYLQLRRAEALVARRQPAQVETALQAAAAIEQTLGGQPTEVRAFSEYLAARVVRENQQAQYQNGLLRRTQFGALSLAARASSAGSPDAAIRILEQAAALAGASPLGNQLRADIQYLRTRSAAPAGGPRAAFVNRWNQAVAATRAARVAPASDPAGFRSAWAGAASAWSGVA